MEIAEDSPISRVFSLLSLLSLRRSLHPIIQFAVVVLFGVLFRASINLAIIYYRLHLHPLSKFSGPRPACISSNWEYALTKEKHPFPEYTFEKLHRKYDTKVLRIGPNELHISDVQLYHQIYNQTTNFKKSRSFYDGFITQHTVFAETDPALHKERRKRLSPIFSRAGVFKLEPIIHEKYLAMERKIRRLCRDQDITMYKAIRCMTMEIISQFAFARSTGMIEESQNSFDCKILDALDGGSAIITEFQHSAVMRFIASTTPKAIIKHLNNDIGMLLDIHSYARSSVEHWRCYGSTVVHPVIFDKLEGLSEEDMASEAVDILVAGADTTAFTMTSALIAITHDAELQANLVQALDQSLEGQVERGQQLSLLQLEKIDILVGCVKEALRLGHAVPGRLPRIVPDSPPFVVDGQVIPPGTTIGMSAYTIHMSEQIWGPDARSFKPERWFTPNAKQLDQYLVTFSKGSRMCIGQNVATAELTICLAYLFFNFEISRGANWVTPQVHDVFTSTYDNQKFGFKLEPRS